MEKRLTDHVIVVKGKVRRPKTTAQIVVDAEKYADPSFECEKPKNPLDFQKTSYVKAFRTKPLWERTNLTSRHISQLFGEPTRICQSHIEYVVKIPSREILKIVVSSRGAVSICGFNRTSTVERWVDRLLNS